MELSKNEKVTFNEGYHKYIDDDFKMYSGITAIIGKCICPDLYGDVDEETLRKAARHGTLCHKLCEAFDNAELTLQDDGNYTALAPIKTYEQAEEVILYNEGDYIADRELKAYVDLIRKYKLKVEASEYLVNDDNFASCIDKVIREGESEFSILDLKFTYQYHEEPVSWQTSFYADMFEAQNEGAKVKNLYCIHIHSYKDGKLTADLHKLKRIKTEILEECKRCFLTDTPFDNPLKKKSLELADITFEIDGKEWNAEEMVEAMEVAKEYADIDKKIKDCFKKWIEEHPEYNKLRLPNILVSQSSQTTSFCFDEKRLKEEMPDLYATYCTGVKTTAPRTTISLTKTKK